MKSILQSNRECYFCGNPVVDPHHVRLGGCSKKKAEEYGLIVYICRKHHTELHNNEVIKKSVQQYAQHTLEKTMTREEYMQIFKKNYL